MKTKIQLVCREQVIQGKFYSASGSQSAYPTLLLLPGFPGNEEDVLGLGEALSSHGLNTLTFNYRGTYQSEGEYSLNNTLEDIQSAFDFLQDEENVRKYHIDPNRLVLGGWSYGGGMALIYTANNPDVGHVFSIAGTDHGEFTREYQRNKAFSTMVDSIFEELKYPTGPVKFSGKLAIRNDLIQNPKPYDLLSHAASLVDRDVLLIGGWDDSNVTIENHILPCYRKLKESGTKKVSINMLQDNHSFENSRVALMEIVLTWIESVFSN